MSPSIRWLRRPLIVGAVVPLIVGAVVLIFVGLGMAGSASAAPGDGLSSDGVAPVNSLDKSAVVFQTGSNTSAGTVRGSPELSAYLSQPTVSTGGQSTITVDLLNEGRMRTGTDLDPRVTTARSLRLEADADDTPLEVTSGDIAVGDVPTGTPTSVPIEIVVPDHVSDGEYDIEVTARYRYTGQIVPQFNTHNDRRGTERFDVTVVVDDGARFAIVDANTTAQVGGTGDVSITVQNVGEETARDATITGTATDTGVLIGDGQREAFVGTWAPEENRTVTFDSTVPADLASGSYPIDMTVSYRDTDGIEMTAPSSRTGIAPIPKQTFHIEDLSSTLEVGYAGTIEGQITNEGPLPVDDAVLIAAPGSERIHLGETRYALSPLNSGESSDFRFDADVSGQADPGPRQIEFTVQYSSGDGTIGIDSTDRVEITPRQPEFAVQTDDISIPAGEQQAIVFEITNQRPETLTSINAGLYADSPLQAINDDAFVAGLEPGETTTIRFEVAAAPDASIETHPVELDFRYDDARGNDRISDVIQYPVDVTEPSGDDGPSTITIVVGLGVVVLVIGAVIWYRRRHAKRIISRRR